VAFLPEELAGAEEGFCSADISAYIRKECWSELTWVLELPPNDTVPLVKFQRKITMALNPFGVICVFMGQRTLSRTKQKPTWIHGCFRRWANGNGFFEVGISTITVT
jgi:hypothetical protein